MVDISEYKAAEERLWGKVQKGDDCWIWTGCFNNGYGQLSVKLNDGSWKTCASHRCSLALKLGREIMPGFEALHTCDNASCVRPDHLFEGTQSQNVQQAYDRGRMVSPFKGRQPKCTILTAAIVAELRRRRRNGESTRMLAAASGVKFVTAGAAISGLSWPHVKELPYKPGRGC